MWARQYSTVARLHVPHSRMQVAICLTLAFAFCVTVAPGSLSTSTKRNLVPSRRLAHMEARNLWKGNIIPHPSVQLNYGLAPHQPPISYVSCDAHDGHPILLLEDIDHLFDNIYCTATALGDPEGSRTMNIVFASHDAFLDAFEAWTELSTFVVVSSHSSCNAVDERAAWKVVHVWGDISRLAIILSVQSTPLHSVGQACRIEYSHIVPGSLGARHMSDLHLRDDFQYTDADYFGFDESGLDPRLVLWPPTNNSLISDGLQAEVGNLDLQLTCVDCSFKSNISLGWDIEYTVGNISCLATNASCFTLTKAAFNVTVLDFAQSASLEVFVGDSFTYAANWTIFDIPDIPQLNFDGITVGPAVGIEVGFSLDVEASLNFTYGAQAQMLPGTFASLNLLNSSGDWNPTVDAKGWDQGGITQNPFRVNSGQFGVAANLWLAPFAEIEFIIGTFNASAKVLAHTPMLTVDAALVTNVNRSCSPIGPEDFETFSAAFTVGADLSIGPVAHFGASTGELGKVLTTLNFSDSFDDDFPGFTFTTPLSPTNGTEHPACFVLVDGSQVTPVASISNPISIASPSVINLEAPGATGTMLAAASAVPTWDFQKIESYSSANGHLPTNVNYQQMLQATAVPVQLLNAIEATASSGSGKLKLNRIWLLLSLGMMFS